MKYEKKHVGNIIFNINADYSFVSRLKETKKEYTVQEVINLTSGNYGNEQLRSFFGVR